jgi:hypothetical protein
MVTKFKDMKHWEWFEAFYHWQYGKPEKFHLRIQNGEYPKELNVLIAQIAIGTIKPKTSSLLKLKLKPSIWLDIYIQIYDELQVLKKDLENEFIVNKQMQKLYSAKYQSILRQKKVNLLKEKAEEHNLTYNTVKTAYKKFIAQLEYWPI